METPREKDFILEGQDAWEIGGPVDGSAYGPGNSYFRTILLTSPDGIYMVISLANDGENSDAQIFDEILETFKFLE